MSEKILVTGATGTVGKALVTALLQKSIHFTAGVRDVEKGKELLGSEVELQKFDFSDPSTFDRATAGINSVFLIGPPMVINMDELLIPFIDYLKAKGIIRVVYLAAFGIEHVKELPFHEIIIDKLEKDGFNYTILKPSFFAQNFKNYEWDNIMQRGITYTVAGNGKAGFIDVNDIAAVAATTLTSDEHEKKTYILTGPESLSYHDAAMLLSEVTGRQIVYPNPSAEEFTGALKAAGAPDYISSYMISVYSIIANGYVDLVTNDVEKVTGKKPTTLREVLTTDFA